MKAHIIENNKVINTIEVESLDFLPNLIDGSIGTIGWTYDGVTLSEPIKTLEELKTTKINEVKAIDEKASVTINDITYNGGDSSASAIAGAVQLAQALGELDVKLWDINNTIATYTFDEAMAISAQIAKTYRDTQFAKYEKIVEINACATFAELDAVVI